MTNSADPDKPTDLDLHCLLRQGMSCLARKGLSGIRFSSYQNSLKDHKGKPYNLYYAEVRGDVSWLSHSPFSDTFSELRQKNTKEC